jgi:hypothetical protein
MIPEKLWQDFTAVAEQQRRKADTLAHEVLRAYLQRKADEALLTRSERAARRSGVRVQQAEEVVRQDRHSRRR